MSRSLELGDLIDKSDHLLNCRGTSVSINRHDDSSLSLGSRSDEISIGSRTTSSIDRSLIAGRSRLVDPALVIQCGKLF